MAADLGFEATELRLGLPGGGEGADQARTGSSGGKRGFAETIDLKLKLEPAGEQAAGEEEEDRQADVVAAAVKEEVVEAVVAAPTDAGGGMMKRSPSQSSVVTAADPEKPRAPKYVFNHPC